MSLVPEVLFVCVHNAGRSQMAAALLDLHAAGRVPVRSAGRRAGGGRQWAASLPDLHAAGRVQVRSAGSEPASELNPRVVEAMREIGVDISQEFPKPLTDESVRAADVVITMGCGDACPIYPGKRYEDWALDDPAGQDLETVRRIRDELDQRLRRLIAELLPDDAAPSS